VLVFISQLPELAAFKRKLLSLPLIFTAVVLLAPEEGVGLVFFRRNGLSDSMEGVAICAQTIVVMHMLPTKMTVVINLELNLDFRFMRFLCFEPSM
jgi:hypothetical protein